MKIILYADTESATDDENGYNDSILGNVKCDRRHVGWLLAIIQLYTPGLWVVKVTAVATDFQAFRVNRREKKNPYTDRQMGIRKYRHLMSGF